MESRAVVSRRRVLGGIVALPLLAGCGLFDTGPDGPDPLIALGDAARGDAALATAAIAADPALGDRLRPLVEARTAHAAALDAEVVRLDESFTPAPAPPAGAATLVQVRTGVLSAAVAAATAALDVPAERVGLVASVAACCGTYAELLG